MNAQRLIPLATLVIGGAFAMNDIRVGVFPAGVVDDPGTYWVYSCGLKRGLWIDADFQEGGLTPHFNELPMKGQEEFPKVHGCVAMWPHRNTAVNFREFLLTFHRKLIEMRS